MIMPAYLDTKCVHNVLFCSYYDYLIYTDTIISYNIFRLT